MPMADRISCRGPTVDMAFKVRRYTFERTREQVLTQSEIDDESKSRENQREWIRREPQLIEQLWQVPQ